MRLSSRALVLCVSACAFLATSITARAETIAAGSLHTVLVKPDGTVWTWGANWNGQLGDGTQTARSTPVQVPTLANIVAVAAGADHTLALASNGSVWAWGANSNGQLGDGTTTMRTSPVLIGTLPNVAAVAAGAAHSAALATDGTIWTWGSNASGQLGNGNLTVTRSTTPLLISTGWTATAIGAGHAHTLAVRSDATLWAWGANANGQLGDGSSSLRSSPVQVTGIAGALAAAGGNAHSAVVLSDGRVFTTGYNLYGQLGHGGTTSRTTMAVVPGLTGVSAIAAGQYFTSARKSNGEVWSWGNGTSGQLGDGLGVTSYAPVRAAIIGTLLRHAAGHNHGIAVTDTGIVYTWGSNTSNQLGDGTSVNRTTPVAISDIDYEWRVAVPRFSVAAGTYYTNQTVVITNATAGSEIHYTVNGADPTLSDPLIASGGTVLVDQILTLKAKAWKAGMPASAVASAVYAMTVQTPTRSPSPGTFTSPQTVTLGTTTPGATLRYTADGVTTPAEPASPIYSAPLTIATTTTLKVRGFRTNWNPSAVLTATYRMNFGTLAPPAVAPAAGNYTSSVTVTLSSIPGATIYYTTNGGNPSQFSTLYSAPFTVTSSLTVKAIAMHPDYSTSPVASHAYTITVAAPAFSLSSGTYAAGQTVTITDATPGATIRYTLDGRDPTETDTTIASGGTLVVGNYTLKARAWKTGSTPSSVTAATYQVAGQLTPPIVDGGDDRSVLVRPDGVPWTWGWQSGNGSHAGSWLPMHPAAITGVTSVSADGQHTLLSTADGSVYAWGWNTNGQLGDGTTTLRLRPVKLSTITTATRVSAGGNHSIALKSDGTVWTWGMNNTGQLGDNSLVQKNSPVNTGLTGITAIAAGRQFSLALKSTGAVYSWGDNSKGQLGDGTTTQRRVPVLVSGITVGGKKAIAIAAGDSYGLALLDDGTLVAWGDNLAGQLGNGSTTQSLTAAAVPSFSSVTSIAAGGSHALAVKSNGTVWSWGNGNSGQLGYQPALGSTQSTPAQVPGLTGIAAVGAGSAHSLAVAADGTVWAWGNNGDGRLGDGTTTNRTSPAPISGPGYVWKVWAPLVTPASATYTVAQTATITSQDSDATLHYTLNGAVPTASDPGIVSGGTLAINQSVTLTVNAWKAGAPTSEPTVAVYELKSLPPLIAPGTGSYAGPVTVTMTNPNASGTVRYTLDGTEPSPVSPEYSTPIAVGHTATVKAKVYTAGWTTSNSAYASYWIVQGAVATPQITPGGGTYTDSQLVRIACDTEGATIRYTLDGSNPDERSAIYRFALVLSATTTVKARGFKTGSTPSETASATFALDSGGAAPTPLLIPAGGRFTTRQTVTVQGAVGSTYRYTVDGRDPAETDQAVGPGGSIVVDRSQVLKVRAWEDGRAPSAVRAAFFVISGAVSAGHAHTLALKSDGSVWAWGYNYFGALGDNTTTSRFTPVAVGISDVQAIAAGYAHSLALRRDGTVWGWGYNTCGQVGDGSTTQRNAPVQVTGLTGVVAIAIGGEASGFITGHSLALKADGTVWAWGCNGWGQLGDGTLTARTTPVQVLGLRGVTAIAARDGFSLAIEGSGAASGTVWAWGNNGIGQLGDSSTQPRSVPVRVPGITDASEIAAGGSFGLALRRDATLWDWGYTWYTRLSDGPSAPAPISLLPPVVGMAAGASGFALTDDGWRWAWGLNVSGELGNNTCGYGTACLVNGRVRQSPADLQLASGGRHTVLVRIDGTVAATGYNWHGQLGNGTQTDNYVPAAVPGFTVADNAWLATDADLDGLTAWREWLAGTDPYRADSNGNGLLDGIEERPGSSAGDPDTDGDGLSNAAELRLGTDPYIADTDADGAIDGVDAFPLDPARTAMPPPNPLDTSPPIIILRAPANARPVGGGGL